MAKPGLAISFTGDAKLQRSMSGLKESMKRRLLRQAMLRAGTVLRKSAAALVPKDSGLLRRAIGLKVSTSKTGITSAIVGARRGFKQVRQDGKLLSRAKSKKALADFKASGKTEGKPETVAATRYAHLVEFGTRRTKAHPFLRPALAQSRGQIQATIATALRELVARQVAKGN